MGEKSATIYEIEFTQRTVRVVRALQTSLGPMKIDIKDTATPFDTSIVDAWIVIEEGVRWLYFATEGECSVRLDLANIISVSRQPKW